MFFYQFIYLYFFLVFLFILFFLFFFFFFFQAEDGIRDIGVTGVQTCALPISTASACSQLPVPRIHPAARPVRPRDRQLAAGAGGRGLGRGGALLRGEPHRPAHHGEEGRAAARAHDRQRARDGHAARRHRARRGGPRARRVDRVGTAHRAGRAVRRRDPFRGGRAAGERRVPRHRHAREDANLRVMLTPPPQRHRFLTIADGQFGPL